MKLFSNKVRDSETWKNAGKKISCQQTCLSKYTKLKVWAKGKSVSPMESHWVQQPHLRVTSCQEQSGVGRHKTSSAELRAFCLTLLCLDIFVLLVFCLYIMISSFCRFCLPAACFLKREKERKIERV